MGMDDFKIEAGKYVPGICFDSKNNIFDIKGDSYPENTTELYTPVFVWLEAYLGSLEKNMEIMFNMELRYFNSSSSQVLTNFFGIMEEYACNGMKVIINWIYDKENEIALEHGEDFQEDAEALVFNLVQKDSNA